MKRLFTGILILAMLVSSVPVYVKAEIKDPATLSKLKSLIIHTSVSPNDVNTLLKNEEDSYAAGDIFSPTTFTYDLPDQLDTSNQLRFRAVPAEEGATVTLHYNDADGVEQTKDITYTSGTSKWANLLLAGKNEFSIVVTPASGSDKEEATYSFTVNSLPTLTALTAKAEGSAVYTDKSFASAETEYTLTIPEDTEEISFSATPRKDAYEVTYNGEVSPTVSVEGKDEVEIAVSVSEGESKVSNYYTITLNRVKKGDFSFITNPLGALVKVYDEKGSEVLPLADNTYHGMLASYQYTYTVTKKGYVGVKKTVPASGGAIYVELTQAEKNETIRTDISSSWPTFRGNKENNAVTSVKTPKNAEEATLYWANKLGEGYGSGATGSPIVVDNYLVCTYGTKIIKADRYSGEVVASGDMVAASNFNIIPPVYGDGMIFVGLSNGQVQAFHADTLESLWVYKDVIGGQPNSPLIYDDGFLYTGFWKSETADANFVCLSATDEDPANETEEKIASWVYTQKGGFYWSGACLQGDYLIVGTDDGNSGATSQTSNLLCFQKSTGKVLDKISGLNADIRSSVTYDSDTNRYYFTTKGGSFYSVSLQPDGTFGKSNETSSGYDIKELTLGKMSTSTPVVYKGRAYVGVSGGENFDGAFSIAVIDLTNWKIAYQAATQGYPQTSGLLTTGYEDEDGYTYVYFIENAKQGKVRVIKDKEGVTEVLDAITETDSKGAELPGCAPVLFTPSGSQAQYAICSAISDEEGTLYFKNDSAYMMAVGSKIESIEVEKQGKVQYVEGEMFDKEGFSVTAHLTNGMTRDITDYVEITDEELTTEDTFVTVSYKHVMYQDALNDGLENLSNQEVRPLWTTVDIQVISEEEKALVDTVIKEISEIGTVTLDKKETIEEIRGHYAALGETLQSYVTNYHDLEDAEEEIVKLLTPEPTVTPPVTPPAIGVTPAPPSADIPATPVIIPQSDAKDSVVPTVTPQKTSVVKKQLTTPKKVTLKKYGKSKKKVKLTWNKVNHAKGYNVKIYRNGKLVRKLTFSKKKKQCVLSKYMKKKGIYYVKVVAKASGNRKDSKAGKSNKIIVK